MTNVYTFPMRKKILERGYPDNVLNRALLQAQDRASVDILHTANIHRIPSVQIYNFLPERFKKS